jgi:hypothetical protein
VACEEKDLKRLNTWEMICAPVVEQGIWRIRTDQENRKKDICTCGRTRNMENKN